MSPTVGRVATITAPRTVTLHRAEFPPPPPGRVLVRVLHVGVCASDLPDWQQGPEPGQAGVPLGHEPVGIVHAVGPGVDGPEVGQVVTGRVDASMADYAYAEPVDLVVVPDGVDPAVALGEPLGCVVDGYRRACPAPGARTAVVGLGFMGLVMARLLALSPTSRVCAIDPRPDARAVAAAAGVTETRAPDGALDRDAFDLVVESSGTQQGLDLASALAAEHGVLSILGYHQTPRAVDVGEWNWKALDVVNAHVRDRWRLADSTRAAMRLLGSGRFPVADLLTHRFDLDHVDRAYEALLAKPPGFVKAVITVG